MLTSRDPLSEEAFASYEPLDDAELERRVALAAESFHTYRRTSYAERAGWLTRAAEILEHEKQALGKLMTREMGKTLKAAVAEAEKCAWVCRYYAEHGERFLADEPVDVGSGEAWVRYQPLGPVLAIMPWNFPFWQVFRFAAPALMAGNVGLLKHASNVPGCALAIEDVLRRAGFPEGAFQALLIRSDRVAALLEDGRIRAATLTGSEGAGRAVGGEAGAQLKKTVLELGGSDPFIVMPSADLEAAITTGVQARVINNGQSCIAAKRFIVHEAVWETFTRGFVERMRSLTVGDPMEAGTDVGPLATAAIRDQVHEQVERSVAAGAKLFTGGQMPEGRGYFYPPTVLAEIPESAPAYREEVFGPVALLFRVPDLDAAIRLANDSSFGLGSSAWTRDEEEMRRFIYELEAGAVFINAMVASDPRLPFGGVKASGYGRELSEHGIREFTNIKAVRISPVETTEVAHTE